MATRAGAGEVSIEIPEAAAAGELHQREQTLNRFVRVVAFGEWAGNAFGAMAFLWATGVLLGGFSSNLNPTDFWFAMVIIFIEAFRIYSRNYKLDNQSLFGTTRALRWINVSFARMLGRPQEGNEVVVVMGIWIDLVTWLPVVGDMFMGILQVGLLFVMSKMKLRGASQQTSRFLRLLQLWAVVIAFIIIYTLQLGRLKAHWVIGAMENPPPPLIPYEPADYNAYYPPTFELASVSAEMLTMVVAALLLISRPPIIVNLTSTSWGRILLSLAKLISAVSLVFGSVVLVWPPAFEIHGGVVDASSFIIAFATMVLSLGSLQTPAPKNFSLVVGCCIDVTLHMLFLWYLVVGMPVLSNVWGIRISIIIPSIVTVLAVLLIENLQIPAAVLQVMLSSSRFQDLQSDYPDPASNLVSAIKVFYVLAICQGCFYITASILGLFSFFPRRMLVRQSKLRGQKGAKAIDLYYESAYSTCMETGLFAAKKTVSLARFATESLINSRSSETRLAGVLILGNLLDESKETDFSEELRTKIKSKETLYTLICMLGWEDIRLNAARVIAHLADRLTIAEIPGMLKLLSPLLDAGNHQLGYQETSVQIASSDGGNAGSQTTHEQLVGGPAQDKQGGCYWVRWCWQRMKDKWSVLEELPLTHQNSLPIMAIVILEKLAHDPDNCVEIAKSTYLISKIIGLISYTTNSTNSNDEQQHVVICASLNFVRTLASTGESIGAALRQQLCNNSFLLNNLESVLEDSRSSPEILSLVIDILTKLALDEDARKEIGSCKVTISKLIAFIWQGGSTNAYDNQSLRMAAGRALANLTIESPANCLVILEETGYEIIKDLKNMLFEDEYICVAASLLQNICAHAKDKLRHQEASNHLSSAFPMVMENIMSAEGKQMEVLIGLVSQICDILPESFIHDQLQLQTNQSELLVQKLVRTLNSNRKPNPEYPRMRRVIVEMVISVVKLCPCYATILREGGMMEALSKVEMTPSKVEKHKVFYGNIGVVLESDPSLTALVATAKCLVNHHS